jgi:hypothetical protein
MEKNISWLIIILYPLITLGLVSLPFFWICKKFKPLKWRHIFLAYFLGMVVFGGWFWFDHWLDQWIYHNAYSTLGWTMNPILEGAVNSYFLVMLYLIISPIIIVKIKYGTWNKKRIFFTVFSLFCLVVFVFVAFVYFIAWNLGQIGMKYF